MLPWIWLANALAAMPSALSGFLSPLRSQAPTASEGIFILRMTCVWPGHFVGMVHSGVSHFFFAHTISFGHVPCSHAVPVLLQVLGLSDSQDFSPGVQIVGRHLPSTQASLPAAQVAVFFAEIPLLWQTIASSPLQNAFPASQTTFSHAPVAQTFELAAQSSITVCFVPPALHNVFLLPSHTCLLGSQRSFAQTPSSQPSPALHGRMVSMVPVPLHFTIALPAHLDEPEVHFSSTQIPPAQTLPSAVQCSPKVADRPLAAQTFCLPSSQYFCPGGHTALTHWPALHTWSAPGQTPGCQVPSARHFL